VFELPDGRLALVIADVCDKGVGAALFMALIRSLLRVVANQNCTDADPDAVLVKTLGGINDYIAQTHSDSNMFATIFFAVLTPSTGVLLYVNAGHDPPVLMESLFSTSSRLEPNGPAVGFTAGVTYQTRSAVMRTGSTLIAFTDGVTDAVGLEAQMFGEVRLLALLDGDRNRSAAATRDQVESALAMHVGQTPRFDDITLLAVRRE